MVDHSIHISRLQADDSCKNIWCRNRASHDRVTFHRSEVQENPTGSEPWTLVRLYAAGPCVSVPWLRWIGYGQQKRAKISAFGLVCGGGHYFRRTSNTRLKFQSWVTHAYECNLTNMPHTAALWCATLQRRAPASNPATQKQDQRSTRNTTGELLRSEQMSNSTLIKKSR